MKKIRLVFAILSLLLVFQASDADPKALLSLPFGTGYMLLDDDHGQAEVRIPVQRADAKLQLGRLQLRVIDVVFREAHSAAMVDGFSLSFEEATASRGDAMIVKVDKDLVLHAGTYNLTVRVSGGAPSADVQDLALTLQRSAVQLSTTTTVYLEQVWGFWGGLTEVPGELRIAETGGLISARAMHFSDLRDPAVPAVPAAGTLRFLPETVDVAAGGNQTISVAPDGRFMLGKTTGKIEISTVAGAGPIDVAYEVHAKRSLVWLPLIGIAGAFAGWLIRVRANQVKQRAAAIETASLVVGNLRAAAVSIPDRDFRALVAGLVNELTACAATDEPAAIVKAAQDASDQLAQATKDFARIQAELAAQVTPWHSLLFQHWRLPAAVVAPVETARTALSEIETLLGNRDVAGARVKFEALAKGPALIRFIDDLNASSTALAELAREFSDTHPPVSDAAAVQLTKASDALQASCPPFPPATEEDPETVRNALGRALARAHEANFSAHQFVRVSQSATGAFVAWAAALLKIGDEAVLAPVKQSLSAGFERLTRALEDPVPNLQVPLEIATSFVAAWSNLLAGHAARPINKVIKDLINEGKWVAAFELAATPPPAHHGSGPNKALALAGAGTPPQATGPAPPGGVDVAAGSASVALGRAMSTGSVFTVRGGLADLAYLRSQSGCAAAIQGAFFLALFLATLIIVYGDAWIGTPKEMLALFVMAFGVDVTSDGVLALASKLKLPEV
jgi:hypothetical protein